MRSPAAAPLRSYPSLLYFSSQRSAVGKPRGNPIHRFGLKADRFSHLVSCIFGRARGQRPYIFIFSSFLCVHPLHLGLLFAFNPCNPRHPFNPRSALYLVFSGEHGGIAPTFLFFHLSYAFIRFIWVCFSPLIRAIRVIRLIRDPPCILYFRASTGASPLRFYFFIFLMRSSASSGFAFRL